MKINAKYGIVAALTMAAFVVAPVAPAIAYSEIKTTVDGKTTTQYKYTEDELAAMKTGSIVFGSSHTAVYTKTYNGEELSAKDVYIKYVLNGTTYYAQASSALDACGAAFTTEFKKAIVTEATGKVASVAAASNTKDAGYYGVEVTIADTTETGMTTPATIKAGATANDPYAIKVSQATVSGSTLTTSAAEDKTLIYGDVEASNASFVTKIGSITVTDVANVKVYKTAADRTNKANVIAANTKLNAGTYYLSYELTTDGNIKYNEAASGNKYTFEGTLTVAPANISSYYDVKAATPIVAFKEDGATNTFTFTKKANVTVPGNVTFDTEYIYLEDTSAKTPADNAYAAAKNAEDTAAYKVTYKNNTAKGTATATITGMNNYTGSVTASFVVDSATLSTIADETVTYTGSAVDVKTITSDTTKYSSGFTISYAGSHTNVADSGVEFTVKGDGSTIVTPVDGLKGKLTIEALDLSQFTGTDATTLLTEGEWAKKTETQKNAGNFVVISSKAYSASAPSVAVYIKGNKVASSVYKTEFTAATKSGDKATIKLTGVDSEVTAGNVYAGTATIQYTTTKSINGATVSGVARAYTYNGESKTPVVTIKDGNETLVEGEDYVISYKNNTAVGTGSVVITGIGNYKGSTKTVNFYIDPAKSSIKKIATGAKKMTVTVKKGTAASGVQIAYRVKGTTKWSYVKTTGTSKTISSLKKGKKYQVVVRSYTKKNGVVTNYSGWSATKTTAAIK